ncbi:MAG: TolC family protein [Luteibaculaceae bacterium]
MYSKLFLLVSLFLCGQNVLWAQESFTLKKAQEYAVNNAYEIKKSLAEINRSKSVVKETTAIGLPQVNAEGRFSNFLDIPVVVVPAEAIGGPAGEFAELVFGTNFSALGGINASQLIFDGSYIVGLQAARTYQMLAQQGLEKSKADIKEQVAQAYFAAAILKESKALLESTLDNTRKLVKESEAFVAQGLIDEVELDQLELQFETLQNQLKGTERNLAISTNILKFQMGLPLETPITLTDNIPTLIETAYDTQNLESLSFNPAQNVNYKLAETNTLLQGLNLKNKQADYLPKLSAFYTFEQNAFRDEFDFFQNRRDWFPTNVWGLSLNVPIFSSGMKHQRVQQAKIELYMAEIDQQIAQESLKLEYQRALENLKTALDNQVNSEKRFTLSERILKRTEIRNKEGVATSLELTQIQNQYIEAKQAHLNASLEVLNSRATLHKLINN